MSGPAERYLTRHQVVELLNESGYPISFSTLTKLCMPSRNEGPPSVGRWANRDLYEPSKVLAWAKARFRYTAHAA
jgi:hypothetical protein